MSSSKSIWFRLGYALERTRHARGSGARKLATLRERRPAGRPRQRPTDPAGWPSADQLVASGAVALVAKALDAWRPRRRTGLTAWLKAGAAGAGAALLVELVRPLLSRRPALPRLGPETFDRVLVGAGQGIVYGAVVEPRLPGSPLVKGALYASAEYAVDPAGGLSRLLGPHAPLRRVPVLGQLLDELDPHDRDYLEHVVFGIALAVLYGSSPSSNGIRPDEGEA